MFVEDSEEAKRHREDPLFDQMFELTEAGLLASKEGEIRPIVSKEITLYMVEETGEFLPINTSCVKIRASENETRMQLGQVPK